MKTITLNLYSYAELSKKAQERALEDWNKDNEDPLLPSHLGNLLKQELEERGIKYDTDSINVLYSLSYCQGDGLMFEGVVTWRNKEIKIKHADNHYYHSKTASFDYEGLTDAEFGQFQAVYEAICKKIERAGYDEIEYQRSEEAFIETCEANEYTFEENGKMRNN